MSDSSERARNRPTSGRRQGRGDQERAMLDFFAEAGLLKRIARSGWWVVGVPRPESVADHSFRTAVIAFYLAHQERADAGRCVMMALFNDIHEARINDLHKMGHHYINFKDAERRVFKDQVSQLPACVKKVLTLLRREYDEQKTLESRLARDADILECLIQAKEYVDQGWEAAEAFFDTAPEHLVTASAQALWKRLREWDSRLWWRDVVSFER